MKTELRSMQLRTDKGKYFLHIHIHICYNSLLGGMVMTTDLDAIVTSCAAFGFKVCIFRKKGKDIARKKT